MNITATKSFPLTLLGLILILVSACEPQSGLSVDAGQASTPASVTPTPLVTPLPTREHFSPGQLVDYTAQTGDTLPALAAHFNTTVDEIRMANPIIPQDATTLPPGMPMKIPIYYLPLWGTPYQMLPDELFVNGPAQVGFDTEAFIQAHPGGWLKSYHEWASEETRTAGGVIDMVATDWSVSPRLLLALIEYQSGGLTQSAPPAGKEQYPLGYAKGGYSGLYMQLVWTANTLNNAYYDYEAGNLASFDHLDGSQERPDPWQNAATVALQVFFSKIIDGEAYTQAVGAAGLARTYAALFGDPWQGSTPHIPGSLRQPDLKLPFLPGKSWAFTGGPHTGWGDGAPLSAIDFAPPSMVGGCVATDEWATAVADGVIARAEPGIAVLDLDGDGDPRTGWDILYLHADLAPGIAKGVKVKVGDNIGHPSCEEGHATGTHIHIARLYNGEWIPAGGTLAFNLEGWVAQAGLQAYEGTLTRFGHTITACECSDQDSQLRSGE